MATGPFHSRQRALAVAPLPQEAGLLSSLAKGFFFLTFAIAVVIPHSLQFVTAVLMAITASLSLLVLRTGSQISYIGICYGISVLVTAIYLGVGLAAGAPLEAVLQTVATYIVSPFLWIIILRVAIQTIGIERLLRFLALLSILACASVALFFFLYFSFGAGAVSFFIEEANIYVGQGFAGATMRVYGSLIFLGAAFFGAPEVVRSSTLRMCLLGGLAIAALTSGRAALILALPIGFLTGVGLRAFIGAEHRGPRVSYGRYFLYALAVVPVIAVIDTLSDDINVLVILQNFLDKVVGGGGSDRVLQTSALLEGVSETYGLGAGHGIGVGFERSALYPWRYENVPIATLFRVGLIGSFLYALVFVIYLVKAFGLAASRQLRPYDQFMLCGFVAVLFAAPTNPYLESFIFQWMFILPMVALDEVRRLGGHGRTSVARSQAWMFRSQQMQAGSQILREKAESP